MLSHIELDIDERAEAIVPKEALADLTAKLLRDEVTLPYSPALCLAKDIKRQFGNAGFVHWLRMMRKFEPPWSNVDRKWLKRRRADWEDLDPYDLKGWCDHTIVDALAVARAAGVGHPSAEAILNELAARSGAKRATIQAELDRQEAAERAAIDAELAAEFAVYEQWLAAGEPANDPLANEHRTRKRRIQQHHIQVEYDALRQWENEHYAANAVDDDVASDDPIYLAHIARDEEIGAEYEAKLAEWQARHGGMDNIKRIFWADKKWPPGVRLADLSKLELSVDPATVPPPPTEIVDSYKRQTEQYAAAMLGPLPDHPELPIHQAESLSRFYAHLPSGKIIYTPTRDLWSSASADKHIGPIKDAMNPNGRGKLASTFLSQFRCVQSMGWDPSEPVIINDRVLTQEGWITSKGDKTFNKYIPPEIARVAGDVTLWLNHIKLVYPNEADHIVNWCAHRVQRPGDKVNHALVFVGKEGIGKDTIIEPVVSAIGRTNFASITAQSFFASDFNGYLKSVMLRIDEVHDLGGESKYAFHDRTKPIIAAPPTAHHINEKFVPHYVARNVCGVILTSNHVDALYLSPSDRRHFVCVSDKRKEDFPTGYFERIHAWFENGGNEAVAFYLTNLDISLFQPKAPPPQTEGWHMLVNAGLAPESGDLADAIEALGKPAALTLQMIRDKTPGDSQLRLLFEDAKQRKVIPKRLAECGYSVVVNPDARESGGRWRMTGSRVAIYGRQDLSEDERLTAARSLATKSSVPPPPPWPR